MSNTNANFEMNGILLGQEVRKRKTPQEKIAIIQQTMEPGMNVSHVARLHGIQPSLLFKWKKQYQEGSLTLQRRSRITMKITRIVRWDITLRENTGGSGHR